MEEEEDVMTKKEMIRENKENKEDQENTEERENQDHSIKRRMNKVRARNKLENMSTKVKVMREEVAATMAQEREEMIEDTRREIRMTSMNKIKKVIDKDPKDQRKVKELMLRMKLISQN